MISAVRISFIVLLLLLGSGLKSQEFSAVYKVPENLKEGQEFVVEITITKGSLAGIARLRMDFPTGFDVNELENGGSIFSYNGQLLQYLWINLPAENTCRVSFKTRVKSGFQGTATIPVRLFYLAEKERREFRFQDLTLEVAGTGTNRFVPYSEKQQGTAIKTGAASSPVTQKKEPEKSPVSSSRPVKKEEVKPSVNNKGKQSDTKPAAGSNQNKDKPSTGKELNKTQTSATTNKKDVPEQISKSVGKIESVSFRIQIGALPQAADKGVIAREFSIAEKDIKEEKHNGLFKYTTGNYPSLQAAKKVMSANPAMKGKAFITGYKDGERIELEEAIRLVNQNK